MRKKEWIKSTSRYNRAKLFINKDWTLDNVPNAYNRSQVVAVMDQLPNKVILDDDQQFTDGETVYEIEMVGERDPFKSYFKSDDISRIFNLPNLGRIVADKNTKYEHNNHYKYFINMISRNSGYRNNKKLLYFTYRGVIKCLFNSRTKLAEKFQDWCLKTLFIHQFGDKLEKQQLSSKLLGVHIDAVRQVFKTNAITTPCVYLFTLGNVKQLRESLKIPTSYLNNMIVCKYGFTKDLQARAYQHSKTLGKITNVCLSLKYYAYVDPQFISDAETDIKDYFNDINVRYKFGSHDELIILSPDKLGKSIKKQYANISNSYGGHIKDLNKKIKDIENKILLQQEKHSLDLLKKDIEITREKHKNDLLKKDIKLLEMELLLAKNNIRI